MSKTFVPILSLFLLAGCKLFDPEEKIPSYIKINSINIQGPFSSTQHNFTDVWVSVNSDVLGVFEIPVEIPVLEEGEVNIRILGGTWIDGQKGNRTNYPYLTSFDTTLNLISGQTTLVTPTFNYGDNFDIAINEDFEDGSDDFEAASYSGSTAMTSDILTIDGARSIILYASSTGDPMELLSSDPFKVPDRSNLTFLEFDYRSSVDFAVGIYAMNQKSYELNFRANPNETKKIYMDLSNEVGVFSDTTSLTLFFDGLEPDSGDYMIFDNIRVLIPKKQ